MENEGTKQSREVRKVVTAYASRVCVFQFTQAAGIGEEMSLSQLIKNVRVPT